MADRRDSSQRNHDTGAKADPGPALSRPCGRVYEITIGGRLTDDWSDWLDGQGGSRGH